MIRNLYIFATILVCSCAHQSKKASDPIVVAPPPLAKVAPKVIENPVVALIDEKPISQKEVVAYAAKHAPELVLLYDKTVVYVLHRLVAAKAEELKMEPQVDPNQQAVKVAIALGVQDRGPNVKMQISHLWIGAAKNKEENLALREALKDFHKDVQLGRAFTDAFIDHAERIGRAHVIDNEGQRTGSFPEVDSMLVGQTGAVTDHNSGYSIIRLISIDIDNNNRFDWLTRSETRRLFKLLSRDQNVRIVVKRPE